jgi:hypothetical protein
MICLHSKVFWLVLILGLLAEAAMAACINVAAPDSAFGPCGSIGHRFVQFHIMGAALGAVAAPGYDLNDPPFADRAVWLVLAYFTGMVQCWIVVAASVYTGRALRRSGYPCHRW